MGVPPTIKSICAKLKQAQKEILVVQMINGRPNLVRMNEIETPVNRWEGIGKMDHYLDKCEWQTTGPGFRRLQDWVEAHWNPMDKKRAPNGTVSAGIGRMQQGEIQLDSTSATKKLIAAAKLYGTELVGKHAAQFALHGMIEIQWTYLLKGPTIDVAKPLDEYCSLLPYREGRQKVNIVPDPRSDWPELPEPHLDNLCALECRYFERVNCRSGEDAQYTSPLLKDGPEQLALLLGLVWRKGFRVFGNWHGVPASVAATVPYRQAIRASGAVWEPVALMLQGFGPKLQQQPLATTELSDLATKCAALPEQARLRVSHAIARMRDSTERIDEEDRVIDLGIALQILFVEEDEKYDPKLIPERAAWHYADSGEEKRQTEEMLGKLCRRHSKVAHGRASERNHELDANLLAEIEDVLRYCVKTIIKEGWPDDWNSAMERSEFRLRQPRADSEILSLKSDSLSWSVKEQREIDRLLEAVWKPIVEKAPLPPANTPPSTISPFSMEAVERQREEGVPFVVVHPARLYMAHPKWPKTASEPLDERTKYYCERDVKKHICQWQKAAADKGLFQFNAPSDADIYHPKNRDDWPMPLHSSHEMDSSVQIAVGTTETSQGPTTAANKVRDQHSADDEKPTVPSSELPMPTISCLEKEWRRLWRAFQYDVHVATDTLLNMLESVHAKHLTERQRLLDTTDNTSNAGANAFEDNVRAGVISRCSPVYPKLRVSLYLIGDRFMERTAPDGPMEQFLFRGWVSDVYDLWESKYRNQLDHEFGKRPGAVRPRQQVLGDLRRIRNNLIHGGVARKGGAANCEILKWFTDGEQMQVRFRHIIDFLNQMVWLSEGEFFTYEEPVTMCAWQIDRKGEPEKPTPDLISVRPIVNPKEQTPCYRYGASVAFENGVFGLVPMEFEKEETEAQEKKIAQKWKGMTVNKRGDLYVPNLITVPASKLYWNCLKGKKQPGPPVWSPAVQFREQKS